MRDAFVYYDHFTILIKLQIRSICADFCASNAKKKQAAPLSADQTQKRSKQIAFFRGAVVCLYFKPRKSARCAAFRRPNAKKKQADCAFSARSRMFILQAPKKCEMCSFPQTKRKKEASRLCFFRAQSYVYTSSAEKVRDAQLSAI